MPWVCIRCPCSLPEPVLHLFSEGREEFYRECPEGSHWEGTRVEADIIVMPLLPFFNGEEGREGRRGGREGGEGRGGEGRGGGREGRREGGREGRREGPAWHLMWCT